MPIKATTPKTSLEIFQFPRCINYKMIVNRTMIWIFHYIEGFHHGEQYAVEVANNVTFNQLVVELSGLPGRKVKYFTYSRGELSPRVIIDNDASLAIAINYFFQERNEKEPCLIVRL